MGGAHTLVVLKTTHFYFISLSDWTSAARVTVGYHGVEWGWEVHSAQHPSLQAFAGSTGTYSMKQNYLSGLYPS